MALQEELRRQGDFLFKYRSHLPLILLLAGIGLRLYQIFLIDEAPGALAQGLHTAAIFVSLFGVLIRAHAVGFSPRNTSGRNTKQGQVAEKLNTTGLYSMIRNPLYVGNYFMWLGISMLTGNLWFVLLFSVVFWIYYERIVFAEEAFLREKFGAPYLDWTETTPPFLPRNLKYIKPEFTFSWKKVLKREKNGFFALFLVFFVFQLVDGLAETPFRVELNWLTIATIAAFALFLALRVISKRTRWLKESR